MRIFILILSLFPSMCFAGSIPSAQIKSALQAKDSSVHWQTKQILVGDINCDGKQDYVIKGKKGNHVHVAVVLGPSPSTDRTYVLDFLTGTEKYQDSLPEKDPKIRLMPLDYDPREMIDGDLEGYRPSKSCMGIELGGLDVDPINLYWNHKKQSLDWWRL
jgi:hypothetical protein